MVIIITDEYFYYINYMLTICCYNQAPLKQMCASFLKQHYISNVHRTLDKYFAKEFTASEISYLTGRSKDKLLPVMLYALSMSSSTFLPFTSDVMGKYYINVFM